MTCYTLNSQQERKFSTGFDRDPVGVGLNVEAEFKIKEHTTAVMDSSFFKLHGQGYNPRTAHRVCIVHNRAKACASVVKIMHNRMYQRFTMAIVISGFPLNTVCKR